MRELLVGEEESQKQLLEKIKKEKDQKKVELEIEVYLKEHLYDKDLKFDDIRLENLKPKVFDYFANHLTEVKARTGQTKGEYLAMNTVDRYFSSAKVKVKMELLRQEKNNPFLKEEHFQLYRRTMVDRVKDRNIDEGKDPVNGREVGSNEDRMNLAKLCIWSNSPKLATFNCISQSKCVEPSLRITSRHNSTRLLTHSFIFVSSFTPSLCAVTSNVPHLR